MRIGFGYDSHRFTEGRAFILGGVDIPYYKGLLGHSDADALTHSIIDAMFGAAALGDIGTHFPVDDDRYKDISSLTLLEYARDEIDKAGYRIGNIDATVILQTPRLSEYISQMQENIAKVLGVEVGRISVKAKTEEGMGFVGRREGIRTSTVCLLEEK